MLQTRKVGPRVVHAKSFHKTIVRSRRPPVKAFSQLFNEYVNIWNLRFSVEKLDSRSVPSAENQSKVFILCHLEFIEMRSRTVCKRGASVRENRSDV